MRTNKLNIQKFCTLITLYLYGVCETVKGKGKGKGHPCTGTEALYRTYGP